MSDVYDVVNFESTGVVHSTDYEARMLHKIEAVPVVDRVPFILDRCRGKRVLNLGSASGNLHALIDAVAAQAFGIDRERPADRLLDLDAPDEVWPELPFVPELIVIGEVLEHLGNPAFLLSRLCIAYPTADALITVPNAYSAAANAWVGRGFENVNADHVAWHSPMTMKTLLGRCGWGVEEWYWYNGKPGTAEGMVFLAR